MSARTTVMFLACHLPYPPLSGGRRRELELIRRVARDFDVHLMVVSKTYEQDRANAHELERFCKQVEVFPAQPLPAGADRAGDPIQVLRHRTPALTRRVQEVLARRGADLIHVEGYYLMQHVPEDTTVPVLLVEQNVEYDLERQRAAAGDRAHDLRTQRAEVAAWRRPDALAALTAEDRDTITSAVRDARVSLVPDGADHLPPPGPGRPGLDRPHAPLLVFLANFAYEPNVDAVDYLYREILPRIRQRAPGVHLWLVGTDPPPRVAALAGHEIRVTGRVPDVAPYIDAADVVVCPLRIGGGVKVKSIEALRRGSCIVSTSVGAQGLPEAARRAITVADDPEAFARAAAELLTDPLLRARAERQSTRAGRWLPSWDDAAAALAAAYDQLLGEAQDATALVSAS